MRNITFDENLEKEKIKAETKVILKRLAKPYYVAKVVLETLKSLNIKWPELKTERFL